MGGGAAGRDWGGVIFSVGASVAAWTLDPPEIALRTAQVLTIVPALLSERSSAW
jgi:hypothetical protein